ncbi:MAG TPA: hypothetical protein VIT65_15820 [Microlunatus sp.]
MTAEPTPGGGLTVVIDLPAATVDRQLQTTAAKTRHDAHPGGR